MKRFIVFFIEQYKVRGGFKDYINDFDDREEAIRYARGLIVPRCQIQVYDIVERKITYEEGTFTNDVQNPLTTFNIALPHVAPLWNLKDFVYTVEDKMWKHFVISDHSKRGDLREFGLEQKGARVIYNPGGSISSAWNAALKEKPDFTILCSVSMRFYWGLESVVEEFKRNINLYAAETQLGFHLCAVTRALTEKVGYVDENFQAYAEDSDWRRRWILAGVGSNRFNVGAMMAGLGIAQKSGEVFNDHRLTDAYYKCKWLGVSGRETTEHPYGENDKDFTYWRKMSPQEIFERASCIK